MITSTSGITNPSELLVERRPYLNRLVLRLSIPVDISSRVLED